MSRGVSYVEICVYVKRCVLCQEVCLMLRGGFYVERCGVSYVKRCVLSQEVCLMSRGVSYVERCVLC